MLTELRISNFALIDQLHLVLPGGFLVLTGETGAGKSLLIDALLLLVGGRASSDQIRFGNPGRFHLVEEAFRELRIGVVEGDVQVAHPVVVGGCLYIRHGDFLYAYDVRSSEL